MTRAVVILPSALTNAATIPAAAGRNLAMKTALAAGVVATVRHTSVHLLVAIHTSRTIKTRTAATIAVRPAAVHMLDAAAGRSMTRAALRAVGANTT